MADHDVIFLENRRTPKIVPKGEKYEPSEAEGKITKRRAATAEEEKTIANGDWVRVNENGDKPSGNKDKHDKYMDKKSGVRPQNNAGETVSARDVGQSERDDLADKGHAMEDGSFPIANCSDLANAVSAVGRAKDVDAAKRHIKKRAAALNCPDVTINFGLDEEDRDLQVMRASVLTADGYEGVTHAGIALVSRNEGEDEEDETTVLLAQRMMDDTDDAEVQETWEFPGGGLEDGEQPFEAALREWTEETGLTMPADAQVVNGWRSEDGVYQGFVMITEEQFSLDGWEPTSECQDVQWINRAEIEGGLVDLRPEVESGTDWDMVFGSTSFEAPESMTAATQVGTAADYMQVDEDGNEVEPEDDLLDEPTLSLEDFGLEPIQMHGVLAPEEAESGDMRGFAAGSMTRRPTTLPFSWQKVNTPGHDSSVVVGSVDRLMRKDGMIHWEGTIMPSDEADEFAGLLAFFGQYGVSVDGDRGSIDEARSEAEGMAWFDACRASGLTAVSIPAFSEAYVAFGPHPDMPAADDESAMTAAGLGATDLLTFKRGPGWVTDPVPTKRIHDYWTKKGQPGYAKIGWGTPGDWTRAKALIGEKIAANSPAAMRFINQIISRWHHDALGYWPGTEGLPGNNPKGTAKRRWHEKHPTAALDEFQRDEVARRLSAEGGREDIEGLGEVDDAESVWEAVLVSSAVGARTLPPLDYFHQHPTMVDDPWAAESGALRIEEPDAAGFRRVWGYAAQWGVCHVGMSGRCVEPPRSYSDDYPAFHLGRTKTSDGYVYTGVLTYGVGHRDADTILSESPTQAYFDNINNAWAAVRCGENERGIWFSGVVLPKMDADDLVKIEASGQVSGEWLGTDMRACLTVNVPGFANEQPSAVYDEDGNVMAMAASAFTTVDNPACAEDTPAETMAAMAQIDAEIRFDEMRETWEASL